MRFATNFVTQETLLLHDSDETWIPSIPPSAVADIIYLGTNDGSRDEVCRDFRWVKPSPEARTCLWPVLPRSRQKIAQEATLGFQKLFLSMGGKSRRSVAAQMNRFVRVQKAVQRAVKKSRPAN